MEGDDMHNIPEKRSGSAQPMMAADVVPVFLVACPGIRPAWQKHLDAWGSEPRGDYNDVSVIVDHLVDSFERGDLSEFPAAFAAIERCLVEGDSKAQELVVIGIIEGIQNVASHRPFGRSVFCKWLGPESHAAWNELCRFWGDA
ncbi:MAG: hypothetical protein HY000_07020 [Planctomycetes bacterium]|nr:hypothetical protein [Planctomycetota bacterium]